MFWVVLLRSGPDKLGQMMVDADSQGNAVLKAKQLMNKNNYLKGLGYPLNAEISLYDCIPFKWAAEELVKSNYHSPFTRAYHDKL